MGEVVGASRLVKTYGALRAVDDVSFSVEAGEFFGILGPNGAGKTTTLEILEGLRPGDGGEAFLLGRPSWPRDTSLLRRIGVQLQASSFFEKLTAREQLRTFAAMYDVRASTADGWLGRVGLEDKADARTEKLSGGQKQRLAIACSLVHDPEIVFLDEPTGSLDPQARRNLWDLLASLNDDGRTVVLTTHYMDEAEALCDRVAIMDHGRILELDSPALLVRGLDAPIRISVARDAVSAADAAAIEAVDDVEESPDALRLTTRDPATVLAGLADRQALDGLQVQGVTLEDVFLTLTGREYRA